VLVSSRDHFVVDETCLKDLATWMGPSKSNLFSCDSQFFLFIPSEWVSILDEWESHSNLSKAC